MVQQQLTFFLWVENISYDKQVDVVWAGEDGVWQTLPAKYHSVLGNDKEYWQARINFSLTNEQSLAGNIQFGLRYRVFAEEHWDNNHGRNYTSEADSGVKLVHNKLVQNIGFPNCLKDLAKKSRSSVEQT